MKVTLTIGLVLSLMVIPLAAEAGRTIPFSGQWSAVEKKMKLNVHLEDQGQVIVNSNRLDTDNEQYEIVVDLEHVKWRSYDITTQLKTVLAKNEKNGEIQGKIASQYTLLNYKPVDELAGHFFIKDNKLNIQHLSAGDIRFSGDVDLDSPYKVDLMCNIASINLDHFLDFWVQDKTYLSDGDLKGDIKITGTVFKPFLRGSLASYGGFIKNLQFDSIHLNVEGNYPNLEVARSTLSKSDGMSFTFNGLVDLSDTKNFKKQLKTLKLEPLVNQSDSEAEWTIKRLDSQEAWATEFKYFMRKDENPSNPESSAMVGFERSMEF